MMAFLIDNLAEAIRSSKKALREGFLITLKLEDRFGILKTPMDWITWQAWHPGYVDYYVYRTGERANSARAQQFVISRVQDVSAMCDVRLRSWIKQNNIELVNFHDALYGSDEYQNHLKATGSDLVMI